MSQQEGLRRGDIPGIQLRRRAVLPVPQERGWLWLTSRERLQRWLASRVDIGLQVGAIWNLEGDSRHGDVFRERLELLEVDRPQRLRATLERMGSAWGVPTLLDVQLLQRSEGCEVSVLQSRFEQLPLSIGLTAWESYRRRWREALNRLEIAVGEES